MPRPTAKRTTGRRCFLVSNRLSTRKTAVRYCELFVKKDPLARTDHRVLAKARSFWDPFHLNNLISVNAVTRMVSGVNPTLGFRFKKVKPLLRFICIHTETHHVTFSRKKIYADFVDVDNRTILNKDGTKTGDWVMLI